jgi:membrane protein YdbS with pleckstrin-like domain
MEVKTFKPNPRYLMKLRVGWTVLALLLLIGGLLLTLALSTDSDIGAEGARTFAVIYTAINLAWWALAMVLSGYYFRSLRYEIHADEIIVHVGIWTRSVKHVPYRTVTNLKVNRDILDRWFFNLGSLNIQTAGMSGSTGAEETLAGLENVQQVYELVAKELRRFRGAMTPTATESEGEALVMPTETLNAILAEIRAIHREMKNDANRR